VDSRRDAAVIAEASRMIIDDLDQIFGPGSDSLAAWCRFDAAWYRIAYPNAPLDDAELRAYYIDHGRVLGHAPNMFFDEPWYRAANPDVQAGIDAGDYGSGYEHYCAIGYLNRSPHWLYDDAVYAQYAPDLTDQVLLDNGCFNRYDHYLKAGAREGRIAHLLFDPRHYHAQFGHEENGRLAAQGGFAHYLYRLWSTRQDTATSVYLDPEWYVAVHAEAAQAIAAGEWLGALHHYLAAPDAALLSPVAAFSESFYRDRNPDAASAIRAGSIRCGYEHFLKTGVFELRDPSPDIDLRHYVDASPRLRAAISAEVCRDAFAWLLRHGPEIEPPPAPPPPPEPEPEPVLLEPSAEMLANPVSGYGRVDFLGFYTPGHGWMFCGWVGPDHAAIDTRATAIAYFEQGHITGPVLMSSYHRDDLEGVGCGIVIFIEGPGRPMGQLISLNVSAEGASWILHPAEGATMMRDHELLPALRPLLGQLRINAAKAQLVAIAGRRGYSGVNTLGELRDRVFVEVDESIFCPPRGVVLIGWMLAGPGVIRSIRLHCGHNEVLLQPELFLRIPRPDVLASVGAQFGFQELRSGFMLHVPTVMLPGEASYLAVETQRGEVGYCGIGEPKLQGMPAIRFILERFDLRYDELVRSFDNVAGPAVASLNRQRLRDRPAQEVIDFGEAPAAPSVSVIVPLYGRLDFMEYQFALFSCHAGMAAHEFIYVLDDPSLQREAEQLAASVFARFAIPFRLVLLGRNLGYAPANNIGLSMARGEYVCFLNSDVFAGTPDWIEQLAARLRTGAQLGAVGPLLVFEDETVQHMGMVFAPLPEFGGWLFPRHERKGWRPPAQGGLHRCAAITGACLMMSRDLARDLGGFDEAYVIGDFEDSDLCMRIAERGLACAVDLDVSLYHLERQSQAGSAMSWRMNLTLYNAWVHEGRWGEKLRASAVAALPAPAPPPTRSARRKVAAPKVAAP
jgi:GT2 family glycosyltransferase